MVRQNIKLAFRNLSKNRAISGLNILGLAIGICAALIIFLIVHYDYSFDKWEPAKERTYQVITKTRPGQFRAAVPLPAPKALKAAVPSIETLAHFIEEPFYAPHISVNDAATHKTTVHTNLEGVIFADQNYFTIFPHHWIAAQPAALNQLNQVVLTQSAAANILPGLTPTAAIGQTIYLQDSLAFTIAGIVADLNQKTDFKAEIFLSMPTLLQSPLLCSLLMPPAWYNLNGNSKCFVILKKGATLSQANQQIAAVYKAHPFNIADIKGYSGSLQPLSDVHFNMDLGGKVSKKTLVQLALLATLLIILAVINYINLTTAMATTRAKEIGVRKTFGGSKRELVYQFLTETTITTCLAALVSLLLIPFALQAFKSFLPEGFKTTAILSPLFLIFIILLIILVSLLAGLYPAYILTKYQPASVLKAQFLPGAPAKNGGLRQILTVSQFAVAQVFLILVVLMSKQIHFVTDHHLGFTQKGIINFTLPNADQTSQHKKNALIQRLNHLPGIQHISLSTAPPIRSGTSEVAISWTKDGRQQNGYHTKYRMIDTNYIHVFELQLVAGRNLGIDTTNLRPQVLINESLMRQMGYNNPHEVIGQKITGFYDHNPTVVGVLKDFNTQSLHYGIQPTVLFGDNFNSCSVVSVKLKPGSSTDWSKVITTIDAGFKSLYPNDVFKFDFFDDAVGELYQSDIRVSKLLHFATAMAIFISLLGLLGLVSFMATRRTKEIGIRKVLGASTTQIILLLSKGLMKLVIIATFIACPVAWYFSNKWLENFVYKTQISWWIFALTMMATILIAMAVLWMRAIKTARINPASSLKTE